MTRKTIQISITIDTEKGTEDLVKYYSDLVTKDPDGRFTYKINTIVTTP